MVVVSNWHFASRTTGQYACVYVQTCEGALENEWVSDHLNKLD
jgi:hypothetical protein